MLNSLEDSYMKKINYGCVSYKPNMGEALTVSSLISDRVITWCVESGKQVKFLTDTWIILVSLCSLACSSLSIEGIDMNVDKYWIERSWSFDLLDNKLPLDIILFLNASLLREDEETKNIVV